MTIAYRAAKRREAAPVNGVHVRPRIYQRPHGVRFAVQCRFVKRCRLQRRDADCEHGQCRENESFHGLLPIWTMKKLFHHALRWQVESGHRRARSCIRHAPRMVGRGIYRAIA